MNASTFTTSRWDRGEERGEEVPVMPGRFPAEGSLEAHERRGQKHQQQLNLLSIPLDIRLLILEELLVSRTPVRDLIPDGFCLKIRPGKLERDHIWYVKSPFDDDDDDDDDDESCSPRHGCRAKEPHRPSIDATVLRVCRQLYNEGVPLLFNNTFQFTSIMAIHFFQESAAYAFLRPRIRRVELVLSIDAFDTPLWHRLAPISTRIHLDSYHHQELRDDVEPFLAAWASAEATRQACFGPTRHLDSLTILFHNWSWCSDNGGPPPCFPHSLSVRSQELLLASMTAMLKQGYPAKAQTCRILGLTSSPDKAEKRRVVLKVEYPCLLKRIRERNARRLTEEELENEQDYADNWMALEHSLRADLRDQLNGVSLH